MPRGMKLEAELKFRARVEDLEPGVGVGGWILEHILVLQGPIEQKCLYISSHEEINNPQGKRLFSNRVASVH